jgi:carbamoyltransferase
MKDLGDISLINIAFYGSHNSTFAIEQDGKILVVMELERFLNAKNIGLGQYNPPHPNQILFLADYVPKFLMKMYNISEFDTCYYQNADCIMDGNTCDLEKYIPAKNYVISLHHEAHAAGCFYQSSYSDALIFSFDGGGNDGMFNVYIATREDGVKLLETVINPVFNYPHFKYDLGFPYMIFGHYMGDIRHEDLATGNLVYPGKLMGLASYGKVREGWVPYFKQFYKNNPEGHNYQKFVDILQTHINKDQITMGLPEIIFDADARFTGEVAYDIAATSQRVFEECFLEIAEPYLKKYPNLPVCVTGGCGLNIILNTRLVNEFHRQVFVGPNPNDCGIAVGMLLNKMKPAEPMDITYAGLPLLGLDSIGEYLNSVTIPILTKTVNIEDVARDLFDGQIVGVARGRSEHGPRALGNRSILCNPAIAGMKDTLNEKVKHREWYRPFAPVVRLEDVSKYFEWNGESRWMSFCPKVRDEWKEKLAAITHIDGTARIQTVTREQHEFLYDLLTEFEKLSGVGVLLNTSFNVNGKPMVSTVRGAFKVFYGSAIDSIIIEDIYITKEQR